MPPFAQDLDIFAAIVFLLDNLLKTMHCVLRSAMLILFYGISFTSIGQKEPMEIWQDQSNPDSTRLQAIDDYSWALINTENLRDSGIALAHIELEYAKQLQNYKYIILAQMSLGIAHFKNGEYDTALQFYEQCKESAQVAGDENSLLKVRNNLASIYRQQGDHQNALKQYKSGLLTAENLKNQELIAVFSSNMGLVYNDMGLFSDAIVYHSKALSVYEQLNNLKGVAKSSGNLAIVYHNLGKYDEALKMHSKSLLMLEKLDDDYETRQLVGSTYLHMAATYRELGDLSMAVTYLNKAEKSLRKVADIAGLGSVYNSFGSVYQTMNETEKALKYHIMALETHDSIGDLRSVSISQIHIGQIENSRQNFPEARKWCEKGLKIAQNARGYVEVIDACACLYQSAKGMNDSEKALFYYELSNLYTDSLEKEKAADKLHDEEIKKIIDAFNNEETSDEVLVAEEKAADNSNGLLVIAGLSIAVVLIVSFFLYNRRRTLSVAKENDIKSLITKSKVISQFRSHEMALQALGNIKSEALKSIHNRDLKSIPDLKDCWVVAPGGNTLVFCQMNSDPTYTLFIYSLFSEIWRQHRQGDLSKANYNLTINQLQGFLLSGPRIHIIDISSL
jgi:tetratricopeptide (TPR) repeat protein